MAVTVQFWGAYTFLKCLSFALLLNITEQIFFAVHNANSTLFIFNHFNINMESLFKIDNFTQAVWVTFAPLHFSK